MVVTSHASGTLDAVVVGLVPAEVGLLDQVLGVGAGTDHAIRKAVEAAAQRLKAFSWCDGVSHGSMGPKVDLSTQTCEADHL